MKEFFIKVWNGIKSAAKAVGAFFAAWHKRNAERREAKRKAKDGSYYFASQWKLMGHKFKKHKLAVAAAIILIIFYVGVAFADFLAPQTTEQYNGDYVNCPPTKIHWIHEGKLIGPYIYKMEKQLVFDGLGWSNVFAETEEVSKIEFFAEGADYKLFGFIPANIHLFEAQGDAEVFLFGADNMGRDLFSRVLLGSQVSLLIPVVGMILTTFFGLLLGSISGYFGGWIDNVIQRIIEVVRSFPQVPLWMALAAAIPGNIAPAKMFLYMTLILSLISWPGLARTVRSNFMSVKKEDYIMAARISGLTPAKIVTKHMVPSFLSYIIVSMTLTLPNLIIGETTLSFLGLGLRSPATSWGVLLTEAQNITALAQYPWKLIPLIFVFLAVLSFNFLGDGLRDAADPYK